MRHLYFNLIYMYFFDWFFFVLFYVFIILFFFFCLWFFCCLTLLYKQLRDDAGYTVTILLLADGPKRH